MIKITAKQIGKLINRKEKYVYQLLMRKGISLKEVDLEKLISLVCEYQRKNNAKKTTTNTPV